MKNVKRLFAALAAMALLLCLAPAAFATGTDSQVPPSASTEEFVDHPDAASPQVESFYSYNIGQGAGSGFAASGTVALDTSGLTIRAYYRGTTPGEDKLLHDLSFIGGNFQDQNIQVRSYKDQNYVDIVGVKYVGPGNDLPFTLCGVSSSFIIRECVLPTDPEDPADPENPSASGSAGLVIKSSSIGKASVNAGEEFTLSLTIYATTSGKKDVSDVVVSVSAAGESTGVTVASGSSSQYIGNMAPGTSQTVSFPMKALESFTGGVSTITVSVTGNGAEGASTNVSVPIVQPDRFEISRVECPEILMVGEEDVLSVVFVNKGRNAVNNLTVSLAGTNLANPNQSEYVGNLAGGTENSVDFDVSGTEAGQMTGTVTVQYEGNDGQTVTLTQEVSCTIEEAYVPDDMWDDPGMVEPTDTEPVSTGMPLFAKILIGVAAAAAVIAVVVVVRKRKAKKAALEAEDEDF